MSTSTATLPGRATPEATSNQTRRLGKSELGCSALGFGCYRINSENPNHRTALQQALSSGLNLIDTSSNYADGESETVVGQVLAEMVEAGEVRRDQVLVVSKIGYCQGSALAVAYQRESEDRPFPEMVKLAPNLWHCIHPEYLDELLAVSMERLGLETLDFCLLHNPEYYLTKAAAYQGKEQDAGKREAELKETRKKFYDRLGRAFAFLEEQVKTGRIGAYGVSSNTFMLPEEHPEATSLARMLEVVEEVCGPDHHFQVVQLPMNLLEWEGVSKVLKLARERNLGTLVNRPLNAYRDQKLVRLADFELDPEEEAEFESALEALEEQEQTFRQEFLPSITGPGVDQLFQWGQFFRDAPRFVEGLDHWLTVEEMSIRPNLAAMTGAMDQAAAAGFPLPWEDWKKGYLDSFRAVSNAIEAIATRISHELVEGVAKKLDRALPEEKREESLSRKALWVAASVKGVDVVLNGMRRSDYVEDSLGVMKWEPLQNAEKILDALN